MQRGDKGYLPNGRIIKMDSLKLIGTIDGRRILVIEPGNHLDEIRWSSAKVDWRGPHPQAKFEVLQEPFSINKFF